MGVNAVHWFRKGLRLHDNPALKECIQGADTIRCVYILDPWFAGSSNVGINRWRFLLQCLEDLDANLRKLNSRLFVIRGQPADVFPRLFKEWNITKLSIEYDSEPFGKERDAAIKKLATEAGVEVIVRTSHTLYDLDKIIELNGGQPPLTYKRFQTLISKMEPLEIPVETITSEVIEKCTTPLSDDHDEKYGVPSLEELGQEEQFTSPIPLWATVMARYLPVLRGFPAKYIYDPWNAPEGIQKVAKCLIGVNYPKPMVNHAEASRLNIERMKQIYQQLSRYRGLGLLASVPSNPNGNGSLMGYSPGENIPGCSSSDENQSVINTFNTAVEDKRPKQGTLFTTADPTAVTPPATADTPPFTSPIPMEGTVVTAVLVTSRLFPPIQATPPMVAPTAPFVTLKIPPVTRDSMPGCCCG
ncbi:cryptochrome-1 [Camelus ferus]|nr:cryptochrome-1 [Camelus ferus]